MQNWDVHAEWFHQYDRMLLLWWCAFFFITAEQSLLVAEVVTDQIHTSQGVVATRKNEETLLRRLPTTRLFIIPLRHAVPGWPLIEDPSLRECHVCRQGPINSQPWNAGIPADPCRWRVSAVARGSFWGWLTGVGILDGRLADPFEIQTRDAASRAGNIDILNFTLNFHSYRWR